MGGIKSTVAHLAPRVGWAEGGGEVQSNVEEGGPLQVEAEDEWSLEPYAETVRDLQAYAEEGRALLLAKAERGKAVVPWVPKDQEKALLPTDRKKRARARWVDGEEGRQQCRQ